MKQFSLIMVISLLLASCARATTQSIIAPTDTPTTVPSLTPIWTLTSIPTMTSTPGLPETIDFEFDKAIPENFAQIVKTTVNQAYWFYVGLGCSPEFHHVTVRARESAGGLVDGIDVGWNDFINVSPNWDSRITHEMAHAMCQLAIKQDQNTGEELEWLLEGMANYFSDNERLIHVGAVSAVPGNILDHQKGMAEWVVSSNFCSYPFKAVEKDIPPLGNGAWARPYPEVGGVAAVAAALLANTSTDGTQALINYYRHLKTEDSDAAFENAFGRTKDEFYQQFTEECQSNFPSLNTIAAPFDALEIPLPMATSAMGTSAPEITIIATGSLVTSESTQKFDGLLVAFCGLQSSQCLPGTPVLSDGSFSTLLGEGKYKISIISPESGNLGWYTKKGLVPDAACADIITVDMKHETALTINLQGQSCQ